LVHWGVHIPSRPVLTPSNVRRGRMWRRKIGCAQAGQNIWPRQKKFSPSESSFISTLSTLKEPNELAVSAAPLSSHLSLASLDPEMQIRLYPTPRRWDQHQRSKTAFFAPSVASKRFGNRGPAIEIFNDRYCPSPYDLNQGAGTSSFRWAL
jgi:hypothetical protein